MAIFSIVKLDPYWMCKWGFNEGLIACLSSYSLICENLIKILNFYYKLKCLRKLGFLELIQNTLSFVLNKGYSYNYYLEISLCTIGSKKKRQSSSHTWGSSFGWENFASSLELRSYCTNWKDTHSKHNLFCLISFSNCPYSTK